MTVERKSCAWIISLKERIVCRRSDRERHRCTAGSSAHARAFGSVRRLARHLRRCYSRLANDLQQSWFAHDREVTEFRLSPQRSCQNSLRRVGVGPPKHGRGSGYCYRTEHTRVSPQAERSRVDTTRNLQSPWHYPIWSVSPNACAQFHWYHDRSVRRHGPCGAARHGMWRGPRRCRGATLAAPRRHQQGSQRH